MMTALLLSASLTAGQPVQPVAQPAQPPAAVAVAPTPVTTAGDVWLVIYSVLPDRTTQFEAIARQVREALARHADESRRTQARDLRLHRSALPNAEGRHMYFLQLPATRGDAERSGYDALIDAVVPDQATALKQQLVSVLDPANPSGNTYLISVR